MSDGLEKDYLQYRGKGVPRVLRLVWTLFAWFAVAYVIWFALPDLREWIGRM